jgi:hypothetical protein
MTRGDPLPPLRVTPSVVQIQKVVHERRDEVATGIALGNPAFIHAARHRAARLTGVEFAHWEWTTKAKMRHGALPGWLRLLMLRGYTQAEADQREAGEGFEHAANPPPAEDLAQLGNHRGIGREPGEGHEREDAAAQQQG